MKKIHVSGFCFLVFAIVFSAKYMSASILLAGSDSLSVDLFRGMFDMIPLEVTVVYLLFSSWVFFFSIRIEREA
ncbi:hypothetical protein OE903_21715 [Bacillus sp. B6(2022)]|nr:hypothetical protein [Bacillus sp. B6(2022)]